MDKTIATHLAKAAVLLERSHIVSARLDATLLLAHVLGIAREQLLANTHNTLNDKEISAFNALVLRRSKNEPVAYITGKKEFWSLDFCVTRDTLIPRPESETLIEAALKRVHDRAKPITILDVGTGSGCLLVALLKELPKAWGVGVDKNERALQVAEENAKRHGVKSRVQWIQNHWCDAINGTFDLIVSNPPYIVEGSMDALMPDVVQYEPRVALAAGHDGLDAYRALSPHVARLLNAEGVALFEVGEGQAHAVAELLHAQGMKTQKTERDLAGIERCVIARHRNSRMGTRRSKATTPQG